MSGIGCKKNDTNNALRESAIEVTGTDSGLGYVISIKQGEDINAIASDYIEQFGGKIKIYSVLSQAGVFVVEMENNVLSNIRCDPRIKAISFNEPGYAT